MRLLTHITDEVIEQVTEDLQYVPFANLPMPNREWRRRNRIHKTPITAKAIYAIRNGHITKTEAKRAFDLGLYIEQRARKRADQVLSILRPSDPTATTTPSTTRTVEWSTPKQLGAPTEG